MTILSPFLSIAFSCDQALQVTRTKLSQAGLLAVQTFNLTTARLGLHDCDCPNHGTKACDCQMVILLVYGEAHEPATLILHGNDGMTWISIANNTFQRVDPRLILSIQHALEELLSEKTITTRLIGHL
jgi:hypothetical protein